MGKRATTVEKLVAKLRSYGYAIPEDYTFRRTYAGHWQLSSGAWKWVIESSGLTIGSDATVRECLLARELESGPHGTIYAND